MPLRELRIRLVAVAAGLVLATTPALPAAAGTSDPFRDRQWGLDQIHAEQAWPTSTGSGTVVAVVDTGVDLAHPDLQGQLVPGATFTGCGKGGGPCGNGDYRGPDGENNDDEHGTHVAGIVAAATDNGIGVAGVAPDAKVMPVKVLEEGSGSYGDIAAGVRWAVDHGADVINLSLGAVPGAQLLPITGVETELADALAYARQHGVLAVAAAGNTATPLCNDPAFTNDVICVAATDRNEAKTWYSELPNKPDMKAVAAPGGAALVSCDDDIWSTVPTGTGSEACGESDYDAYAGTSMATPHVAGVAALLYAQGRDVADVENVLLATSRQPVTGSTGVYSPTHGWGIVDAEAAVAAPITSTAGTTAGSTDGSGGENGKGNRGGKDKPRNNPR
jgi:subtilisin family serine protease